MDSVKLIITLLIGGGFVGLILQSRYLRAKNRELKSKDKVNSIQIKSISDVLKFVNLYIETKKKIKKEREDVTSTVDKIKDDGSLTKEVQNEAKKQVVRTNIDNFDIIDWN